MRLHIYFIGMIDGRFASAICPTCVLFSTHLYRSCIYTFRRKKFFGHKFHIDRRDSEGSSKLPSMNHFTLYKKRIPKQIICLFNIAFYDLFPHKRTADVPSLILDLVYHPKGIAICRGQFFQQNMIPFPVNRNQAITLENRVKIRYVNTKNAVDFICEKYHVRNAKELEFLYGQYQEEAREKETFRKTSDDLDYYTQNLLQYLTRLRMYDTRVWLTHANALVDSREMVELKHELLTRRQKLRARMEYSVGSIHEMKGEALKNMSKLGNNAYQLEQIIRKIEAMNPVFK